MYWANFLHIYQPPNQWQEVLDDVVRTAYLPIIEILKKYPWAKLTLNISGSLTEQLAKRGYKKVIWGLRRLIERGQVELTESSKYHAFLPLLPEKEIERQIQLNYQTNKFYFGKFYKPKAVHLPEMAYSEKIAKVIKKLGYSLLVVDEISFKGKLNKKNVRSKIYTLKNHPNLKIFIKPRKPSYLFQNGLIKNSKDFYSCLKGFKENDCLITVVDGEVFGHHYRGMEKVLERIYSERKIESKKLSELLEIYPTNREIKPFPATWGTTETELKKKIYYAQWKYPGNPIHKIQWELTYFAIKVIEKSKSDPNYKKARKVLDEGLFSCHYWAGSTVPWWDPRLVEKGARYLSQSVLSLKKVPKSTRERAKELYFQIVEKAFKWDEKGIAKTKSLKYTEKVRKEIKKLINHEEISENTFHN